MDASIAIPLGHRKIVWATAVIAAAAGAVGFPPVGVPLALGIATYAAIKLSKPHQIVRGRTLSPRQHHRAALNTAVGITGIAAVLSAMLVAVDLANVLEHRLHEALATSHSRGELKLGQIVDECQSLLCARATVIKLATPAAFGIAKLNGFALHEQTIYHWRTSSRRS